MISLRGMSEDVCFCIMMCAGIGGERVRGRNVLHLTMRCRCRESKYIRDKLLPQTALFRDLDRNECFLSS